MPGILCVIEPTNKLKGCNLVPRVFSLFNMAAAREKTLAHSRSRDQNLKRGWRFIQNGGYGEKSEKIWVRDILR